MRRRIEAMIRAQMTHRFRRVAQRRTARAERDADVVGLQCLELRQCGFERCALLVGLGGEEFEAYRDHVPVPTNAGLASVPSSPRKRGSILILATPTDKW